jgi:hypothetical protein
MEEPHITQGGNQPLARAYLNLPKAAGAGFDFLSGSFEECPDAD